MRALLISVLAWPLFLGLLPLRTQAQDAPNAVTDADPRCQALQSAALANDLPLEFLTRLIWQESRFDDFAISHAGAQGIAQFMPATAVGIKLANPFDALAAIDKSAQFLHDLKNQFGNLGLAAAAYNAGPKRVSDWLVGRRPLPQVTVHYVRIITGHAPEDWRTPQSTAIDLNLPTVVPCPEIVKLFAAQRIAAAHAAGKTGEPTAPPRPSWGVQLIGNASWYRVRVGSDTRNDAERLCSNLRAVGGSCLVQMN